MTNRFRLFNEYNGLDLHIEPIDSYSPPHNQHLVPAPGGSSGPKIPIESLGKLGKIDPGPVYLTGLWSLNFMCAWDLRILSAAELDCR